MNVLNMNVRHYIVRAINSDLLNNKKQNKNESANLY